MKKLVSIALAAAVSLTFCAGMTAGAEAEGKVLKFSVTIDKEAGKEAYAIPGMFSDENEGLYTPVQGDVFEYDIRIDNTAPGDIMANGPDFTLKGGGQLKDLPGVVGKGDNRSLHHTTDLSDLAYEWYHREVSLDPAVGKVFTTFWLQVGTKTDKAFKGTVTIYLDNVRITNNGTVKRVFFEEQADFDAFNQESVYNIAGNNNSNVNQNTKFLSKFVLKTVDLAEAAPAPTETPTEAPTETPTQAPTQAPATVKTEASTNASTAESTTAADDASSKADENDSSFPLVPVIVAVVAVIVIAGVVIGFVLYKKKNGPDDGNGPAPDAGNNSD